MLAQPPALPPRGTVVAYVPDPAAQASRHERVTLLQYARRIAGLLGYEDGGFHDPQAHYAPPLYYVPASTLTAAQAHALGIRGPQDLFGGVVPHAFVATKVISHPLVSPDAQAIDGWSGDLAPRLAGAVLAGFSVFTPADAREAGTRLLQSGPVRIKPVLAAGGRGQAVARDEPGLRELLDAVDPEELRVHGLVLEEDLEDVTTFSVGQVQVGELVATYFGVQKLTTDNQGLEVFGGSELTVARGGFDELLSVRPDPDVVQAIRQARLYDASVRACYPGFYASRSNYDVLLGRDARGAQRCAVLEQSWRAGGATGPELAALEVFRRDPHRQWVRARGVECFGDSPEPPAGATVYYRGTDPEVGPLTKYTVVEEE